jgi:hypothetical protein
MLGVEGEEIVVVAWDRDKDDAFTQAFWISSSTVSAFGLGG